jgi:hypothetical protein
MSDFEDWETLRDGRPLTDAHGEAYRQLSEAEYRLDDLRTRRGLSREQLDERADARPDRSFAQLADELVALTRVVEALGGHVDVRAVFDDETITLLREPAGGDADAG